MGKFTGVLIASDFDNTIVFTEEFLRLGLTLPEISKENRQAIEYFISEGGTFSLATGRALPAFSSIVPTIPNNGPTILFNGAAIYDFSNNTYLLQNFLPECARSCIDEVLCEIPEAAVEIYHDDASIHCVHPNDITRQHLFLTHSSAESLSSALESPMPISKILLEISPDRTFELYEYVSKKTWSSNYEIIPSGKGLIEITAKGANKGSAVQALASLLHIKPEHLYCIGDQANDIPMLFHSSIPFAPANSIEKVKCIPNIHILPHCNANAIASMVQELNAIYA